MSTYIDFSALGEVLLAALIAGVGLVTMFSLGLVGLSAYEGAVKRGSLTGQRGNPAPLVGSIVCFAIVLAGVALGIYAILDK